MEGIEKLTEKVESGEEGSARYCILEIDSPEALQHSLISQYGERHGIAAYHNIRQMVQKRRVGLPILFF